MKKRFVYPALALALITAAIGGCSRQKSPGLPTLFNQEWMFIRQDSANIDKILPGNIPNNKWEKITLPHTAYLEPLVVSGSQWTGICWYRKLFRAPRGSKRSHTGLLFDGAMNDAIVYLNGVEIERHTGGYLPFYVDLSDDLRYGKENEIMIRLDNRDNPSIPPGKPLSELDFLYYSGLYRNVSLYVRNRLHITNAAEEDTLYGGGVITSFTNISKSEALLTVSVMVRNDDRIPRSFCLSNTLLDAAGTVTATNTSREAELEPGTGKRFTVTMTVTQPALWSPAHPFLYTLRSELISGNDVIDCTETRTGIRSVSVSPSGGMLVNGEKITVRGTNRHQEYPYIGYALSDNASYRDAFKIREAGFNLVRCSHYPPAPAFLDACDELGLMVIDAIPGWQFMGDSLFRQASISDTRLMCRRDRNHPSVVMWEASLNETWMPYSFLSDLNSVVKEEMPYGNSITCSWMDTIADVFIPARQHARQPDYWKNYRKNKPVFICEYGDWEYYANNAGFHQTEFSDLEPASRNSRQLRAAGERALLQQAYNFQEAHNDNLYGPCFGDANWLMYDYNRGYAPDIEASGIMDIFRLPKFAYWFYRSQQDEPVCFIAHYNLPSSGLKVRVFSNADSVALFRNDTLIAVSEPDRDMNSVNLSHPPFTFSLPDYRPGTLRASGMRNGKEIVSHSVTTPGPPAALRLSSDLSNKPLSADGADAIFIYATMVDSTGNIINTSDRTVMFTVKGDATIVGENPVKAEAGIATVIIRAGTNPGKIMVRASADSLAQAELMTVSRR